MIPETNPAGRQGLDVRFLFPRSMVPGSDPRPADRTQWEWGRYNGPTVYGQGVLFWLSPAKYAGMRRTGDVPCSGHPLAA